VHEKYGEIKVKIRGTTRDLQVWQFFNMDCAVPMVSNVKLRYNHVLVLVDSCSWYPFAYPIKSLSTKSVSDALMRMFKIAGIPIGTTIASDNGSNFR
jgi:hypothetical protein